MQGCDPALPDTEPAGLLLRALAVGLLAGAAALLLRWAATEAPHLAVAGPRPGAGRGRWRRPSARVARPGARRPARRPRARPRLALGRRAARGWDILEAVVLRNGVLPLRSALVRAASSLVTQASAGAVGREGPIVLVAAATASRRRRGASASRRASGACSSAAASPPVSPAPTTRRSGRPCSRWRSSSAASRSRRSRRSRSPPRRPRCSPGRPSAATRCSTCPPLTLCRALGDRALRRARRARRRGRGRASCFALRASAALFSRAAPAAAGGDGHRRPRARPRRPCATPRSSATAARRSPRSSSGPGASSTSWRCSLLRLVVTPLAVGLGHGGRRLHADPLHRRDARPRLRRGRPGARPRPRRRPGRLRARRAWAACSPAPRTRRSPRW